MGIVVPFPGSNPLGHRILTALALRDGSWLASLLRRAEGDDALLDEVREAIGVLKHRLVEPALEAWAQAEGRAAREVLERLLLETGLHDPRILAVLLRVLARDPELGALSLARYGDAAALPHLAATLDALAPSAHDHAIDAVAFAVEELGGDLTPSQLAKWEELARLRATARPTPLKRALTT